MVYGEIGQMPALNPEILTWARTTAGLSLDEAGHAIGLKDAHGVSSADRLAALESGNEEPTRSLLLRMAKAYRRSLLVFYLDAPPATGDRGQDFRTVQGSEPPSYSPVLDALIRDIRGRQSIIKSLLEDLEAPSLPFIGSASMSVVVRSLAASIVQQTKFSLPEFRSQENVGQAFSYLRSRMEDAGIFALLLGNLGSHHTNISVDIFRGFAIADDIAPLAVINDQDARVAWSFTLLHEVVHLWLGTTGISGSRAENNIERYCNDVASEVLLPADENRELSRVRSTSFEELVNSVTALAKVRRISRPMVGYRLYQLSVISQKTWKILAEHFRKERLSSKELDAFEQGRSEGGPNYYVVKRHRLGKALLGLASRSLSEGLLTYTKAGQLLGVRAVNVDPLLFGETRTRRNRA
jgi:Zn-dependent peptidase ImmA (M78 family)